MGVIDTARYYIGRVTYVFGADDLDGGKADCSSFTQSVFEKNGITIGRDTEAQWTGIGEKVARNQLQVGDLVFFKNTYNSGKKDGVSHVGIYSGNGNFIHCGNDGVQESSLSSNYYSSHYLGAKRIEGANEQAYVESSSSSDSLGLVWWGDVVKVVLSTLLIIAGVVLFIFGVKDEVIDTAHKIIK